MLPQQAADRASITSPLPIQLKNQQVHRACKLAAWDTSAQHLAQSASCAASTTSAPQGPATAAAPLCFATDGKVHRTLSRKSGRRNAPDITVRRPVRGNATTRDLHPRKKPSPIPGLGCPSARTDERARQPDKVRRLGDQSREKMHLMPTALVGI
jgi:hypothetical protein